MKFMSSVLVVKDMKKSREFYEGFLNQKVQMDLGANVSYEGFALLTLERWTDFINKKKSDINLDKTNEVELYFEVLDYDKFLEKLKSEKNIELVHDTKEFPWGQRGIRFYDPDNHIVEVGETLESVVKKQLDDGMSVDEIIEKTGLPKEYIMEIKKN
ncbi:MAG: glyoxalase/bleomycin resistance/dioxygenase family protein [Methanobrevibacter sp.]|nr:glyoxalase/bleomycin resistance/dioxygenase family protein [Methanobrevibacter sp.]